MGKELEAKVKHHHVWEYYLKRWSENGSDIWYTTKTRKIAFDSPKGLARENDFYKIKPLSKKHIRYIRSFIAQADRPIQKLNTSFLEKIIRFQSIEALYAKSVPKDNKIEMHFNALKSNLLENLHTGIEISARAILDELAMRNFSVLNEPKNMIVFCNYFGHQMSRTKSFKDKVFSNREYVNNNDVFKILEECWWCHSYMIGNNIGYSIYKASKSENHCFLINDTNMPFITSDQPIVNVFKGLNDDIAPVTEDECDFYYPISPSVAYMISGSKRFPRGELNITLDIVEEMNSKVAKNANVHIFGNTKNSIKPFVKYISIQKKKCEVYFSSVSVGVKK